ncbi:MAG: hypothetical protein AB1704_42570 [Pseudomonadota bacterium]|uniref:hypothetical protein n=1 Tax=Paraburkholderia ferrariae TaxID=386056 RepID=UPI00069366D6|nr:hypothetical protein [Paraburkholderia ferrariae]
MSGAAVETMIANGTLTRHMLNAPHNQAFQQGLEHYLQAIDSGRAYVWVLTPDNSPRSMFDAGREWTRLHLKATAMGFRMQPHSHALHDFPEIAPLRTAMHDAVGAPVGSRLQMPGRTGFAPAAPHSPRQAVQKQFV